MMLHFPAFALIGLILASLAPAAVAQEVPAPPEGHVLDLARVLDATTEARIERVLAEILDASGVDMEVMTLSDLASQGGGSQRLETYASELYAAWKGATEEAGDGILLVVTTDPADARIALGADFPPVYNDRAARVLGTFVLPAFRDGRIPDGIEAGVLSARDQLVAPYLAGLPVSAGEGFPLPVPELPSTLPYLLAGVLLLGAFVLLSLRKARRLKTCPRCGEQELTRTFEVIEAPSGLTQGSGIEHRLCKSCGFTDREVFTLSRGLSGYRKTSGK